MSETDDLFQKLGLGAAPWVIRVYLVLLVVFALMVLATALPWAPEALSALASDGVKTVLGALLGALSLVGERSLREYSNTGSGA